MNRVFWKGKYICHDGNVGCPKCGDSNVAAWEFCKTPCAFGEITPCESYGRVQIGRGTDANCGVRGWKRYECGPNIYFLALSSNSEWYWWIQNDIPKMVSMMI